ncbi:MAG: coenzyme-B sulfoethylthiotransferase subunit beta [Candidatus Alkanophagales archaeon]
MEKEEDRISIYDDRGKLLAEKVPLSAISPLRNAAIRRMLYCLKRTAIVDVKKLEDSLRTASVGGTMAIGCECRILGRELDLPLVENIGAIADEVRKMIRVGEDDDADVKVLDALLVVQLPRARVETAADYSQTYLVTAAAVAYAIVKIFGLGVFDGVDMLKAALLGRYPQTVSPDGAVSALLTFPTKLETMGVAYRSLTVNTIVALAGKRTFDAVAIAAALEHAAAFESGNALGPYERFQLLGFGYQGLNGENMVYELVREHGRGTLADIIEAVVRRALEDNVIFVEKELPSGFKVYAPRDAALWNAYAAAGLLAATIQCVGASRAVQSAPSAMLFYNDLLEMQTGLPSVDFGRALGTAITYEWLTHATYGGGAPGIMSGEHVVTRASKGFIIPCACAAACLDAGTQIYSPEMTSGKIFKIRRVLPEFHRPLESIAQAAAEVGV